MPKVTVLLPTFRRNESGRLSKAIMSVLAQTFTDFELYVVDDGSTDGSAATISSFMKIDRRVIHYRFEENIGLPALTTIRAFRESQGTLIAWMFDDCEWEPTYLEIMVNAMEDTPSAGIAYAQCLAHYPDKSRVIGEPLDILRMKQGNNHIANGATIIRRSVFELIGWYDPRLVLVRNNDWDFLQRASNSIEFLFVEKVLCHEYGVALQDSLGNTYSIDINLRNAIKSCPNRLDLSIDRIDQIDILSLPEGINPTDEMLKSHLRLALEFAIKGWRTDILKRIELNKSFIRIAGPFGDIGALIKWWSSEYARDMKNQLAEKDIYISQQAEYIARQDFLLANSTFTAKIKRALKRILKINPDKS